MGFRDRLRAAEPIVLDAAMGTALREGTGDRAHVRSIHLAHLRAGAEVVLTNTFGARVPDEAALREAIACARGAIAESGRPAFVALSLWADCEAREVGRAASIGVEQGVDAVWLETSMSLDRATDALAAARSSGLPCAITLAFARLADVDEAVARWTNAGAEVVGLNCSPWPSEAGALARLVERLNTRIPLAIKPDGARLPIQRWAAEVRGAIEAGARLVGGCCGTTGAHLAALRAAQA